jgi:heme exporter protein B
LSVVRSNTLAAALAITRKDIAIEFRTRSAFFAAAVFALLAAVVFYFAWSPADVPVDVRAPGVIWVIFIFSGLLGLQRSFAVELTDRAIDGLLSSPVSRMSIFVGKMAANCLFLLGIQVVALPANILFFNVELGSWFFAFLLVLLLATLGMAAVGTLFSVMVVNTRLAELMMPMLSLPFFLPIVAMAASCTQLLMAGGTVAEIAAQLKVLVAFDLVFVSASAVVFPYTLED